MEKSDGEAGTSFVEIEGSMDVEGVREGAEAEAEAQDAVADTVMLEVDPEGVLLDTPVA